MRRLRFLTLVLLLSLLFTTTTYATEVTTQVATTQAPEQNQTTMPPNQTETSTQNPDVIDAPIMSYAKITVLYSTGIAIDPNDVFTIKVRSLSTNEVYAIDVVAKDLAGKIGKLDLAVGTYVIDHIEYFGNNAALMEQGFSINTQFDVGDDVNNTGTLYIHIGKETSEILQKKTQFFAYYLNGVQTSFENTTEATTEETYTPSTTEYTPQDVTESSTEVSTEAPEKQNDFAKFKPARLIPIMIILIIGALIIYGLKRSGKLRSNKY